MPLDLPARVQLLRRCEKLCPTVDKKSCRKVRNRQTNCERRFWGQDIAVSWIGELGRWLEILVSIHPTSRCKGYRRTIRVEAGITPMGAGLQKPVLCWVPSESGSLDVAQKLIKLFVDVREADWPE
jgi:hypothetical protein